VNSARRQIDDVHGDPIIVEPADYYSGTNGAVVQIRIAAKESPDMHDFIWAGNAAQLRELITALEAFGQRAK
jgi:hypothetical protein